MEFYRLNTARDSYYDEAFALYEQSFPKHEQRFPDKQRALMANPLYHFNAVLEGGVCIGILLYWEGSGYAYIEHFAISPSIRGKSMGSLALEAFCKDRPLVVLEIDPPVDDISVRRERFYQRLGFIKNDYEHKHPAYRKEFPPHELVVMSYPRQMTGNEYRTFQRELSEVVMKDAAD
jgi:ribosomal protein S18 acetylase RimI-like enzyme